MSNDECGMRNENHRRTGLAEIIRTSRGPVWSPNEDAYREFYGAYFPRLLGYLLAVTYGDEEAAREALQLTMLRVVRHIKPFPDEQVLWSWLTVLARSAAIDEKRKQRRYFALLDRFFQRNPEPSEGAHATVDPEAVLMELLQENVQELQPAERDLVERKYLQGESVAQIAAALSVSEKAIESRLTRVREKLRQNVLQKLRDHARK